MLIGHWQQSEELTVDTARAVVIRSTRRRMMLMVDGEVVGFDMPLRVRLRPRALTVLARRSSLTRRHPRDSTAAPRSHRDSSCADRSPLRPPFRPA